MYGPDYKPTMVMSPYVAGYTLYARWEIDSSILSVTSSGDGASALDVYGNEAITLRDAVNALIDNPLLVGTDGRRRVTFEKLDATNRVIRLARQIEIPAGVRSFEINGLCTLEPGFVHGRVLCRLHLPRRRRIPLGGHMLVHGQPCRRSGGRRGHRP